MEQIVGKLREAITSSVFHQISYKKRLDSHFFSILNSLRWVLEAFEHCKHTFVVILSIIERPKHWKLDQGDVA